MTSIEFFNLLISEIPDAIPGTMFGSLCAKMPNGKSGIMLKNDELIVKISSVLAGKEDFKVFTPMENRPMNGWFVIPFENRDLWKKYAKISCSEVAKLEAKPKKPKK